MKVYNVEIFDIADSIFFESRFKNVYHCQTEKFEYYYDYFDQEKNVIVLPRDENVKIRQVIRVSDTLNSNIQFIGIVIAVDYINKRQMQITYSDFVNTFFDLAMSFDTSIQNKASTMSLESYLKDKAEVFANVQDWRSVDMAEQIEFVLGSDSVKKWGFNIKPDYENKKGALINFKDVLIDRSATEYGVWFRQTFTDRYIINISKVDNSYKYLETNAPFVINANVHIESNRNAVNTLTVYEASLTNETLYYLHEDGTVSEDLQGSLEPHIYTESIINIEDGESFSTRAKEEATQRLTAETLNNYIEVEMPLGIGDFQTWEIGQKVKIYHNGLEIDTVLTGYKMKDTFTLIFGSIRLDLTKRIRRLNV